jgi:hypothetical protein
VISKRDKLQAEEEASRHGAITLLGRVLLPTQSATPIRGRPSTPVIPLKSASENRPTDSLTSERNSHPFRTSNFRALIHRTFFG